jgi:translation initiation factor 3 subunit B
LQNRKAQREFRERKASYVKSLEQRIRVYESNEVQANVELQRVARRLKEENEQLREQNRQLTERVTILEGGNSAMVAIPPTRIARRSRGSGSGSHHQQHSQPPESIYNQSQGFPADVTAYDVMSSTPAFPASTNSPGYPQYFPQQVR